jgi:5S rRNA maturation endonuclease (ribonuclease M5)
MKFNPKLKTDIDKYKDYVIIVEGRKDLKIFNSLGFPRVYTIHESGIPIRDRVIQISSELDKKDKVCILTDLDKKGKKLYMLLKELFQEQSIKLDSSLRGLLIKARVLHIEEITNFFSALDQIG